MTLTAPKAPPRRSFDPEYRELYGPLLRFAEGLVGNRADAEEAVHDAFAAALAQDHLDDPRAWLFRVTRNTAISIIRRRRGLVALELVGDAACQLPTPVARAELSEDMGLLRHGLDRLSERARSALLLRELAGLSYLEIGRVLDVSEANVKVLIFRARRSLHELMDAVTTRCDDVQLALSAAADGEQGRLSAGRARLHAAHCPGCAEFEASVGAQRTRLASLVPVTVAAPGAKMAAVAAHTAAGGKAGGLWGMKALLAALAAGASLTAAGGVAVWHGGGLVGHPGHPAPPRQAPPERPGGGRGTAAGGSRAAPAVTGRWAAAPTRGASRGEDSPTGTEDGSGGSSGAPESGDRAGGSGGETSDGGGQGSGGDATTTAAEGGGQTSSTITTAGSGEPSDGGGATSGASTDGGSTTGGSTTGGSTTGGSGDGEQGG